jgi:hypothetical protein
LTEYQMKPVLTHQTDRTDGTGIIPVYWTPNAKLRAPFHLPEQAVDENGGGSRGARGRAGASRSLPPPPMDIRVLCRLFPPALTIWDL